MNRDEIIVLNRSTLEQIALITMPPHSGPRHGVFDASYKTLYIAAQLDNSLYVLQRPNTDSLQFSIKYTIPLLENPQKTDETAAIRLFKNHLYISIRGSDEIVVLEITDSEPRIIQRCSSGGKHPRDIALSPDGKFLLSANRNSGDVIAFPIDKKTGIIGNPCSQAHISQAVSIVFENK